MNLATLCKSIADAIRAKKGTSALIDPQDFPTEIASIPSGGGNDAAIVSRTISGTYSNSTVTEVGAYAFFGCSSLTGVNLPNCTSYGEYCFAYSGITSFTFKTGDTVNAYQFRYCGNLQSITLPSDITEIPNYFCAYCTSLTQVVFPGTVNSITQWAFGSCWSCLLFDFRASTAVPTLTNRTAFSDMNENAKIVVPDALYDDWIAANNWNHSSIVGHIVKASDYTA